MAKLTASDEVDLYKNVLAQCLAMSPNSGNAKEDAKAASERAMAAVEQYRQVCKEQ